MFDDNEKPTDHEMLVILASEALEDEGFGAEDLVTTLQVNGFEHILAEAQETLVISEDIDAGDGEDESEDVPNDPDADTTNEG